MSRTQFTIVRAERKIVMQRIFPASPERVWQAITDPTLIPQWWGPSHYETIVDKMDLSVGGDWRFRNISADGNEHAFHGTYLEIEPPFRLVQTFNYEPIGPGHESVETATLEALPDGQTRMTMVSVFGAIEDLDGTVASGMEGGARETWSRLSGLLVELSAADGRLIEISRTFAAPLARVWQAFTDPELLAQWWGPAGFSTRVEALDLNEGGRWRYVMIAPDGSEFPAEGTFLEIVTQQKIVTTDELAADHPPLPGVDLPQGIITTMLFAQQGSGTRLTVQMLHPTATERQKHEQMGVVAGYNSGLDCLEELLVQPLARSNAGKLTTFLWFNGQAEEAVNWYKEVFGEVDIRDIARYGKEAAARGGMPEGSAMTVNFTLFGHAFIALNGGPQYKFNPAISFFISCETQAEIDRYWGLLSADPEQEQCGWLLDKYGVSWQIVPAILGHLMSAGSGQQSEAVSHALLQMKKLDIAALQAAFDSA